jgi:hypothetical protein
VAQCELNAEEDAEAAAMAQHDASWPPASPKKVLLDLRKASPNKIFS